MPSAAVGGSPSATDGENFAVCLLRLCCVLGAHGELANSGSGVLTLNKYKSVIDINRNLQSANINHISKITTTRIANLDP